MKSEKLHGVVRQGIIELYDPIDVPEGTKVEVIIIEESYKNAWDRQKDLMTQGFRMEIDQKIKRDNLYERN
jgi:predicted DNA-binding antitoxin AbrB/MazE fold protein